MTSEIHNATIDKFTLDCERGFLSFNMNFSYGGYCQGVGGYCTYNPNQRDGEINDFTGKLLINLMRVFDITELSEIPKYCRIEKEAKSMSGMITKIGHIVEDRWLDLRNGFEVVKNGYIEKKGIFSDIKFREVTPEQREYFKKNGKRIEDEGFIVYRLPNGDVLVDDYKGEDK